MPDKLGCGSPVSYWFVYAISADICGEADEGGLARLRREFKTYRKSTARLISLGIRSPYQESPHPSCQYRMNISAKLGRTLLIDIHAILCIVMCRVTMM